LQIWLEFNTRDTLSLKPETEIVFLPKMLAAKANTTRKALKPFQAAGLKTHSKFFLLSNLSPRGVDGHLGLSTAFTKKKMRRTGFRRQRHCPVSPGTWVARLFLNQNWGGAARTHRTSSLAFQPFAGCPINVDPACDISTGLPLRVIETRKLPRSFFNHEGQRVAGARP
jgi:hypothetical protein